MNLFISDNFTWFGRSPLTRCYKHDGSTLSKCVVHGLIPSEVKLCDSLHYESFGCLQICRDNSNPWSQLLGDMLCCSHVILILSGWLFTSVFWWVGVRPAVSWCSPSSVDHRIMLSSIVHFLNDLMCLLCKKT